MKSVLKTKHLFVLLTLVLLTFNTHALDITVNGFFNGGAILVIDGKHKLMRIGDTSPEGVELVAADDESATVLFDGEQQILRKGRAFQTEFEAPTKLQARIPSSLGGHYVTPGRINGRPVEMMVDTGATVIAINANTAKALGIDYSKGERVQLNTANGVTLGSAVMLNSVRIGEVELNQIEAVVTHSNFPAEILLGNSFLSRVDMRRENGVLVLEKNQ